MSRVRTRSYTCEVCSRPTTRLFGFLGVVDPFDDGVGASMRAAVHGYCRDHRDEVAAGFPAALRELGEVRFMGEPPAELRPGEVGAFIAYVDQQRIELATALGVPIEPSDGSLDAPPQDCPHCGASLIWDDGPHVLEAAQRGNARAWACSNCGAAGMLMGTSQ